MKLAIALFVHFAPDFVLLLFCAAVMVALCVAL